MANQITGKILYIYPTQQITSKDGSKTIEKRNMVIDCTRFDPYTGERGVENTPMMEFTGDRCAELDKFQIGQIVTVSFDIQGMRYRDKQGNEQIFTRVRPYRIEPRQSQPKQVQAQQPVQQYTQRQEDFTSASSDSEDLPF